MQIRNFLHYVITGLILVMLTACGGGSSGDVTLTPEEQALNTIVNYVDHGGEAPEVEDYQTLSITGVTVENIEAVNGLIRDLNITTATTIQSAVDALEVFRAYALSNGNNGHPPTQADYETLGITGVTDSNRDALNDLIVGKIPAEVDSQEEIQGVVNSYIPVITYSLTYLAGENGTLTGEVTQTIEKNANASEVTAVANNGYHFVGWSDGLRENSRLDRNVQSNISVTANFEADRVFGEAGSHPVTYHDEVEDNMTRVYYPTDIPDTEKVPVIFFASGYGSDDAKDYESLLTFIASHGYYVIYAKHAWDSVFSNLDKMLNEANGILPKVDTTRIGVIGHSLGAGYTFNILKYFSDKGYGENGRFIMALEAWYAFNLSAKEMKNLPSNTNVVMQQYGEGGNNAVNNTDPRIPLTEFYLLDSIANSQKDWQIYVNADHNYPYGNKAYAQMQYILKPLDALMAYTFKGTAEAHDIALEVGNDDPYNGGQGIQVVNSSADYDYKCYDNTRLGIDYCAMRQFEKSIDTNTSITKIDLNSSYREPNFDTNVTRITDRSILDENLTIWNAHPYPKQGSAWNSDGSVLRMQYRVYDTNTFEELPLTKDLAVGDAYAILGSPQHGPADMRWSTTDPNVIYVLDSAQKFVKITLNADRTARSKDIIIDLSSKGYEDISIGNNEGNFDHQNSKIVFAAKKAGEDTVYAMLYELGKVDVEWEYPLARGLWGQENSDPDNFDWITIDPTGQHIVASTQLKIFLYDLNLENEVQLEDEANHGDIGIDIHGDPTYIQFKFAGEQGIWAYNLRTHNKYKLLPSKYNGGHISCRNTQRLGWCYANVSQEGHKEALAIKLDPLVTGVVERYAQTHISEQNKGCTQINVNHDGSKILFSSDWNEGSADDYQWDLDNFKGCTDRTRKIKIDTYQVRVRE